MSREPICKRPTIPLYLSDAERHALRYIPGAITNPNTVTVRAIRSIDALADALEKVLDVIPASPCPDCGATLDENCPKSCALETARNTLLAVRRGH